MDTYLPQGCKHYLEGKQLYPGFELGFLCPFPMALTVTSNSVTILRHKSIYFLSQVFKRARRKSMALRFYLDLFLKWIKSLFTFYPTSKRWLYSKMTFELSCDCIRLNTSKRNADGISAIFILLLQEACFLRGIPYKNDHVPISARWKTRKYLISDITFGKRYCIWDFIIPSISTYGMKTISLIDIKLINKVSIWSQWVWKS